MRERESRVVTMLAARVRMGDDWRDVTILNVSRRGLMLRAEQTLPRGSYIEVRRASTVIVGRVVWHRDAQCGVRAQDVIDLPGLMAAKNAGPKSWKQGEEDRRKSDRRPATASYLHVATGRQLQFAAVILAILCSCILLTKMVASSFNAAMDRIEHTL